MPRLAPGTHVGPYEIVSFIAAGGMGEVYRGHDARLGRPVAIKVLPASSFDDATSVLRFEREARAAAAVSHPNLVAIHDVGREGDVHYIVMDLLQGETLRERLTGGALSWPKGVDLAIAVADGLGAVHAKGFVHRDLKPENVFLTSDGWVTLLDFGLARPPVASSTDETAPRALTTEGMVVGTIAYMAPEQLRGEEVDARTDIFAAGCVLHEMLTGQPLFRRTAQVDTIAAILSEREDVELPKHIPRKLAKIVRRCLARGPEERFQSASDLAFALRLVGNAASQAPAAAREASIAVLPFANLSGDRDNDYFSDGLSEEILNSLTRVPGLKVTARSSAFAFRGKQEDVRRIGEALGVRTILEGGVRLAGSRVRVTAQLVDTSSGYQLWSERYERAMTDVFDVQDEIAAAIVGTLHLRLVAPKRSTPNVDAYHAYLKSRYHFGKLSPERLRLSREYAEEAIAIDPEYAPPHAQLAECFLQTAVYGWARGVETVPKARAAAQRAVALDASEPGAHMTLARIAGEFDFDWDAAVRECRIALASDRISPPIRALCAQFVLWPLRRIDELDAAIAPALQQDPLSPMPRFTRAQGLVARGSFDRALAELRAVQEMHESFWPAYSAEAAIHTTTAQTDAAIIALEKGLAIAPWNTLFPGMLAGFCLRAGERARAEEMIAQVDAHPSAALAALGRGTYHYVCSEFDAVEEQWKTLMATRYPVDAFYFTWLCLSEPFRDSPPGRRLRLALRLPET